MGLPRHSLSPEELAAVIAAEKQGEPFLAYRDGNGELHLEQLAPRVLLTIGRSPDSDLVLEWDGEVSRSHAQLAQAGGEWTLVDDGLSRNGSFVNDRRLRGRVRLRDDDTIRLGSTVLYYRAPAIAQHKSTIVSRVTDEVKLTPAERRVLVELCRPFLIGAEAPTPTTNREIAEQLSVSVAAVKTQVRSLFRELEIDDLPQNRKRAALASRAIASGLVSRQDLVE